MGQLLSNTASGLAPAGLKVLTATTTVLQTMMAD